MKTNEINGSAKKIESDINALLSASGMPVGLKLSQHWESAVGCKWCEFGQSFHVWLPAIATPMINRVVDTFKKAGFADVGFAVDPTNEAFVQIDALSR